MNKVKVLKLVQETTQPFKEAWTDARNTAHNIVVGSLPKHIQNNERRLLKMESNEEAIKDDEWLDLTEKDNPLTLDIDSFFGDMDIGL